MFGSDIKIGLPTSILPPETINNISSEEDLENILQNIGGKGEESNFYSADANQSMVKSQRDLSIKALQHQAEKIKFRSINKFPFASIGDTVQVTIPDVNRGRGVPRNILFAVVSIKDGEYYELSNKEGTIEQHYSRFQFDVCLEPLITIDEVPNTKKSLKEIAKNVIVRWSGLSTLCM
ncbi:hypothetical protein QTP88_023221 [Uroleucon formosanum]